MPESPSGCDIYLTRVWCYGRSLQLTPRQGIIAAAAAGEAAGRTPRGGVAVRFGYEEEFDTGVTEAPTLDSPTPKKRPIPAEGGLHCSGFAVCDALN